jgi:hypothetical protein
MRKLEGVVLGTLLVAFTFTKPAAAHFKLTAPPSWLKEVPDAIGGGGPQKGSPCGPGGIDDKQPIPTSGIVTDFHAGDKVELDWVDTVAHPGYFRIALAENRSDLKDPTITQDASCSFDETMVPKTASGNVLADGILFRSRNGFNGQAGTKFTYMVTLPSTPCDKCTLQVIQVMENDIQGLSNCHYFHCADIRILPAGGGSGTGGATSSGTGGTTGSAGTTGGGGVTGLPLGMGGTTTTSSAGGMSGLAGMLGLGGGSVGVPTGVGGSGPAGSPGTITPPAAGNGGTTTGTVPGGGGGDTTSEAGATGNGAESQGSSDGGCAVALRSHATSSALTGVAFLALLGLGRRRRARSSRCG